MTKIEWVKNADGSSGHTWNPITGCTKISLGCQHCYAETMAKRLRSMGINQYQNVITDDGHWTGITEFTPSKLQEPLRRKRSTTYFVCSMSDLFHEGVELEWLTDIFEVMAKTPQHTYQVLTKRSDRLMPLWDEIGTGVAYRLEKQREPGFWPLDNVWLGVSVENQTMADERIPYLLRTPAAVKFLSCEPLLGLINLEDLAFEAAGPEWAGYNPLVDWIIIGGESGSKARPFDCQWGLDLIEECRGARIPVFVKQLGSNVHINGNVANDMDHDFGPKGGDWERWPKSLQIRQMPVGVAETT